MRSTQPFRSSLSTRPVTPPSCKEFESVDTSRANPAQLAVQKKISDVLSYQLKLANTNNFIDAYRVATIFEVAVLAVVFALSFLLPRHIRPEAYNVAA